MKKLLLLPLLVLFGCGQGTVDATGRYLLTGVLTVDTCADPSQASEEVLDFGEWLLVALQDEYLFMQGDFALSSTDGENFLLESSGVDFWTGCEYTNTFTAALAFNEVDVTGDISLHQVVPACGEEDESVCDRVWELLGNKQ